jgi:hypothetical protein
LLSLRRSIPSYVPCHWPPSIPPRAAVALTTLAKYELRLTGRLLVGGLKLATEGHDDSTLKLDVRLCILQPMSALRRRRAPAARGGYHA